jgi:hypothetical protein
MIDVVSLPAVRRRVGARIAYVHEHPLSAEEGHLLKGEVRGGEDQDEAHVQQSLPPVGALRAVHVEVSCHVITPRHATPRTVTRIARAIVRTSSPMNWMIHE